MFNKNISYILTPKVVNGKINTISILEVMMGKCFDKEEAFAEMPKNISSCLSAYYSGSDITAEDELGNLKIVIKEAENIRTYAFERKTEGKVVLRYSASIHPLFDWPNPALSLHNRENGATGFAGTFLLNPFGEWYYTIDYDDIEIPNTICACSYGIGKIENEPLEHMVANYICFAFGVPHHFNNRGKLNILYFENDLKFMDEITQNISLYFDYMDKMFHGTDRPYFIFLYRKDKVFNIDLTGTASLNLCLMGYGDELVNEYKDIESTIVHELVHNFLMIDDEKSSYSSFFAEGAADYFSVMIPYQLGVNDKETTIDKINKLLRFYYSNPMKEESINYSLNMSWTHSYANRINYGKGLIFMMSLESLLKEHNAKKTLIDVMSEMTKSQQMQEVSLLDFLNMMDSYTDGYSSRCFKTLSGKAKAIPPHKFIEGYQLVQDSVRVEENGFDDTVAFSNPKVVTGIKINSNAYKAGLRNGDIILNKIDEWTLGKNEDMMSILFVKRENQIIELRYLARGEETYCFSYKKG